MLAPRRSLHRARRAYRLHGRLPRRLRRPRPAARALTIAAGLWFALLFAVLGLSETGAAGNQLGFVAAALAGMSGTVLVGVGRFERGLWCLGAMFVAGQAAAVTLLW